MKASLHLIKNLGQVHSNSKMVIIIQVNFLMDYNKGKGSSIQLIDLYMMDNGKKVIWTELENYI